MKYIITFPKLLISTMYDHLFSRHWENPLNHNGMTISKFVSHNLKTILPKFDRNGQEVINIEMYTEQPN